MADVYARVAICVFDHASQTWVPVEQQAALDAAELDEPPSFLNVLTDALARHPQWRVRIDSRGWHGCVTDFQVVLGDSFTWETVIIRRKRGGERLAALELRGAVRRLEARIEERFNRDARFVAACDLEAGDAVALDAEGKARAVWMTKARAEGKTAELERYTSGVLSEVASNFGIPATLLEAPPQAELANRAAAGHPCHCTDETIWASGCQCGGY